MSSATPMPAGVRQKIAAGASVLALTAAVGNFGHVYRLARDAGQTREMAAAIALMPDLLLLLCLFKLRYHRYAFTAWAGLAVAVVFIGWGSVHDASTPTRGAVGLSPLVFAVLAAGLLEARPDPAPVAVEQPAAPKPRPAPKPKPAPASTPAPAPEVKAQLHSVPDDDPIVAAARAAADAIRERRERVSKRTLMAELGRAGFPVGDARALQLLKEQGVA